ncbi:MAG: hypothetical protein WC295_03640 [Methanoregula sp.]|jgi:hypothetical protein
MTPKISGIALYPLELEVKGGGTIPSGIDRGTVPVPHTKACDVPCASKVNYHLVCAGNLKEDFDHVFVQGELIKTTGVFAASENLERYLLEKIGSDGSYRTHWKWPNKNSYKEIDAIYEVKLDLIKEVTIGNPIWVEPQIPFLITLKTPLKPIDPNSMAGQ